MAVSDNQSSERIVANAEFGVPKESFCERGIRTFTLRYRMINPATGSLQYCSRTIATSMMVVPELEEMYGQMLQLAPTVRERAGSDGHFFLIDPEATIVGYTSINLRTLSDRDLAWLNCMFAEFEGAVLMEHCTEKCEVCRNDRSGH